VVKTSGSFKEWVKSCCWGHWKKSN